MNDQTPSTEVTEVKAVKHDIKSGGPVAGIIPQGIDETFRVSRALATAGDMIPSVFRGKEGAIMAAIMRGAEIGLGPMQSLSNIAVINGRASIWGDALPALMQRHGHQIDHKITGDGDDMKAVATLVRGDTGQKIIREFSVADAKKAGLWAKQGPWKAYPERMLGMRARSWACRDGAADAMMGIAVAEEQQDIQPMRDVTPPEPPKTGYAEMARKAREEAAQAGQSKPDAIDGEVLPPDDGNDSGASEEMMRKAFSEGINAAANPDASRGDNPYTDDAILAGKWFAGFDEVREGQGDDEQGDTDAARDSGDEEANDAGGDTGDLLSRGS